MPDKYKMTFNEVQFYLEEAKSCEERQKKELIERNRYPEIIKYYEGDQGEPDSKKKLAIINEYFPNTNSIIAEVMYQNPDIIATQTRPFPQDVKDRFAMSFPEDLGITEEQVMSSALAFGFNKADALTENRLGLFDMIMAGYCAIEVNHINSKDMVESPEPGEKLGFFDSVKSSVKKRFSESTSTEKIEEEFEKSIPVKELAYASPDETYIRRWNPLDVLFDYRAERIKDIKYIIKKIRMTHAEFAARYPELAKKIPAGDQIPFTMHTKEEDKKTVLLYEYQIKREDNKYHSFVLCPSYKLHEIDSWDRPYVTNGFNVKIGTLHKYGKLYPVSMGKINKGIQDDINNYTTFMMEVAERNIPKFVVDKKKVKADGQLALRSTNVNDLIEVEGDPSNAVTPLQPTKVSPENKELLSLFDTIKDKLWSVSAQRLGESGKAEFATELDIQEAGFQARQGDIQEGLRMLIKAELDTEKDIIVQFWDNEVFFKVTGGRKPAWYEPKVIQDPLNPEQTIIENPLTDILTWDFEIDVDISTSLKPNKERKKKELIEFATFLISGDMINFTMLHQKIPSMEVLEKTAREWGWNPETLWTDAPAPPPIEEGVEQQIPGAV